MKSLRLQFSFAIIFNLEIKMKIFAFFLLRKANLFSILKHSEYTCQCNKCSTQCNTRMKNHSTWCYKQFTVPSKFQQKTKSYSFVICFELTSLYSLMVMVQQQFVNLGSFEYKFESIDSVKKTYELIFCLSLNKPIECLVE